MNKSLKLITIILSTIITSATFAADNSLKSQVDAYIHAHPQMKRLNLVAKGPFEYSASSTQLNPAQPVMVTVTNRTDIYDYPQKGKPDLYCIKANGARPLKVALNFDYHFDYKLAPGVPTLIPAMPLDVDPNYAGIIFTDDNGSNHPNYLAFTSWPISSHKNPEMMLISSVDTLSDPVNAPSAAALFQDDYNYYKVKDGALPDCA